MAKKKAFYLCNVKKPSEHCKTNCFCGVPHAAISDRTGGSCSKKIYCKIVNKFVWCEKLTEKELKKWEDKGWERDENQ